MEPYDVIVNQPVVIDNVSVRISGSWPSSYDLSKG